MKIEDPIKKISGNNRNLEKMDFWEQQELGKMDFGKHGKEWGMIRKKCMPLPNVQTHQ